MIEPETVSSFFIFQDGMMLVRPSAKFIKVITGKATKSL